MKLRAITADITTLDVDAIVNAANASLLGGAGVNGTIHQAAGPELLKECVALEGCKTGDAKITKGYNLPATHIIHAVGPVYRGGQNDEAALLASCYERSLVLAMEYHVHSIAFPAISCGIYGYPIEEAAEIAITSVQQFLTKHPVDMEVIFTCFDEETTVIYQSLLDRLT